VSNDNNPTDDGDLHGTHVAGTIGAKGNDGSALPGHLDVQLMILKFSMPRAVGTTTNARRAIQYATDKGAHIINASWGGTGGGHC